MHSEPTRTIYEHSTSLFLIDEAPKGKQNVAQECEIVALSLLLLPPFSLESSALNFSPAARPMNV